MNIYTRTLGKFSRHKIFEDNHLVATNKKVCHVLKFLRLQENIHDHEITNKNGTKRFLTYAHTVST